MTEAAVLLAQPRRSAEWRRSLQQRSHNRALGRAVKTAVRSLERADSVEQVFHTLVDVADVLEASHLALQAGGHELCHGDREARGPRSSYPLADGRQQVGHVEVVWNNGRTAIDRDDEIALERVLPALAAALRRTSSAGEGGGRVIALR